MEEERKDGDYLYYHRKLFKELQEKHDREREEFKGKQSELLKEKKQLDKKDNEITKSIKNIKISLRQLRAAIGLWVLLPFLGGGAGYLMGSQNWNYRIVTKTYNMKTNETIGNEVITFQSDSFVYKVIVKKCLPWEEKVDHKGYTREVLEYEYIERVPDKKYDPNKILQSITPKYYREEKEKLDINDNIDEPEILIVESELDSNERIPDKSFAIIFSIICFLMTGILVSKNQIMGLLEDYNVKKLKKDLESYKITKKTIQEQYVTVGDKVVKLQEEYEDKSIVAEIEELLDQELLDTVKKYVKTNENNK